MHAEMDYSNLSEYLADMAKRDRREVISRLITLLTHLLKWEYQPDHRSGSWQGTILEQRRELCMLLESGTLHNHAQSVLAEAYDKRGSKLPPKTGLPRRGVSGRMRLGFGTAACRRRIRRFSVLDSFSPRRFDVVVQLTVKNQLERPSRPEWAMQREFSWPAGYWTARFHDPFEWHMAACGWQLSLLSKGHDVTSQHQHIEAVRTGKGFYLPAHYQPWCSTQPLLAAARVGRHSGPLQCG